MPQTIADLRASDPESFGQLSDEGIVRVLHQTDYPDIPEEEIAKRLGIKPAAPPAPPPSGVMRRYIADPAIGLLQGAIQVPQSAVGLADLATGGRVGKFLENQDGMVGFRPNEAIDSLNQYLSPEAQAAQKAVQDASRGEEGDDQGIMSRAVRVGKAAIQNPSVIVQSAAQSLPSMGAGGVIGRGALAIAPRLGALASGIGEGITTMGSQAEQIRTDPNNPSGLLTPKQVALAAGSGAVTGAIGAGSSTLAQKLGIEEAHNLLAGIHANPVAKTTLVRKVLGGAVTEGLLEELPQSTQEQVAQNIATGQPLDKDVDQQAVLGALTGGAMGGGAQFMGHKSHGDVMREDLQPEVGPLSAAVNAGIESAAQTADANPPVPPATPTTPRQANAATAEAIRSLPVEDQQDALHLYALGNRMDVAPGVRRYAQNRLDTMLAPFALQQEQAAQATDEQAQGEADKAAQQQADAQQKEAEKAQADADAEREANMSAARQLSRTQAPDSAFNDAAAKSLTQAFTGEGYSGGAVNLADHALNEGDIAALKSAGLADENGQMTPQLHQEWTAERDSRLSAQTDAATEAQKAADAKKAGKPLPKTLPQPSIEAKFERDQQAPAAPTGTQFASDVASTTGKPFVTMRAAMTALSKAGADTHEMVNVEGGIVIRKKPSTAVLHNGEEPQPSHAEVANAARIDLAQQDGVQPVGPGDQRGVEVPGAVPAGAGAGGSGKRARGTGAAVGSGDGAGQRAAATASQAGVGADQVLPGAGGGGLPAAVAPKKPRAPKKPKAAVAADDHKAAWTRQTTASRLGALEAAGITGLRAQTAAKMAWDALRPRTRDALVKAQSQSTDEQKPAQAKPAPAAAVRGDSGAVQRRATTTALGIADEIKRVGVTHLVGREVSSPEQLAELAQVHRDPRHETFRYFLTKGNTIVHSTAVSSRMPGYSDIIPGGKSDTASVIGHLRSLMEHSGADGYYLLHNHPSGDPTPSHADIALTNGIALQVPGLKAHVIINSGKYSVIKAGDTAKDGGGQTFTKDFGPDELLKASKPSSIIGTTVEHPDELAALAKGMQKPGVITAIGVDSKNKVRSISEAPASILTRNAPYLAGLVRRLMRSSGSRSISLVGEPDVITSKPIQNALKAGIIRDAIAPGWERSEAQRGVGHEESPFDQTAGRLVAQEPVSTRVPTAVKATEDAIANRLSIGLEAAKADPKSFEKNVGLITKYPNYRPAPTVRTIDQKAERFINMVRDNLIWLHDQVPADIRNRSKLWYDGGRHLIDQWTKKYGYKDSQVAASIAVLSPQKDWFRNVSLAERVLDTIHDHQDTPWSKEMDATAARIFAKPQYASTLAEVKGKTLAQVGDDPFLQAMWVRTYDEAHNPKAYRLMTPEGGFGENVKNENGSDAKVAWGSLAEIAKSISVLKDGSVPNISDQLGAAHKVRNFYNNLVNPNSKAGEVTIDTHAVGAGLLRPMSSASTEVLHNFGASGSSSSAITGSQGTYGLYAEAYRRAAQARGILAREMQSITWEAARGLFTPQFKANQAKQTKSVGTSDIDRVWDNYRSKRISLDEARQQILQLAGGVNDPAWVRSAPGTHEGAGYSSYARELPGSRVPGGRARSDAGRAGAAAPARAAERGLSYGSQAARSDEAGARGLSERGRVRGSTGGVDDASGAHPRDDQALAGLPATVKVDGRDVTFGPFAPARAAARAYAEKAGISYTPPTTYAKVDKERATRIAQAFDDMKHDPADPRVKASYDAMIRETLAQWQAIKATGLKVEFIKDGDPYGNPRNAIQDVVNNNHLWVYPTDAGFGGTESANVDISGNPLLAVVPGEKISGQQVRANDIFRVVHDYFGHIKEGVGFRADGEENAWRSHAAMYSDAARPAMTTETRGQNSWVNYGPYAEFNKTASGADTQYAPQKIGLLPDWVSSEGASDELRANESTEPYPRTTVARMEAVITKADRIAGQWKSAPETIVVSSMDDPAVPETVRDYTGRMPGRAEGFTYNGKVYLVADALHNDSDVARVMLHESLGHFGLRGTYGAALGTILDRIGVLNAGKVRRMAADLALDYDKQSQRRMAAEELLARIAEQSPQLGWARRAIVAVRSWLRENIPGYKSMMLSDDELVRDYITPVRERVVGGIKPEVTAAMNQFMPTDFSDTLPPADFSADNKGSMRAMESALQSAYNNVRDVRLPGDYIANDLLSNASNKLSWWHKTVGTQFNLAKREPLFRRTFDAVQTFLNDVSHYANSSAKLAPSILPSLENFSDIKKQPLSAGDVKALSRPVFEGTLSWTRGDDGAPVDLGARRREFEKLSSFDQAQRLFKDGLVSEAELKRWQASPLNIFEGAVRNRIEANYLKAGIVFTPDELKSRFGLNDRQVGLYQEFRNATDRAISQMAITQMLRVAGDDAADIRGAISDMTDADAAGIALRDHLYQLAEQQEARRDILNDTGNKMVEIADKATGLIEHGYAPLSRYGQHTVYVTQGNEQQYFGMFETGREANKMARKMKTLFPDSQVAQGMVSQEAFKQFSGITPETVELFGEMLGLDGTGNDEADKAFQAYLKLAKNSRSAMTRLIHRKGVAGFSEDVGRVLAGFVYSSARQSSTNMHMGEVVQSAADIPKEMGDLKDQALKLVDYIRAPQEEAYKLRGLLFSQYLGGSIASALVNATQPFTIAWPFLSQYGGAAKAARRMASGVRLANSTATGDAVLDAALKKAADEGIVAPQEVHQLMAQAQGKGTFISGDGSRVGSYGAFVHNGFKRLQFVWGKVFSIAELWNRRVTYIAAFKTAQEQGIENPDAFARDAIAQTMFTYNKGNKPNWARGAIGGTLFTFKQYAVNYLELANRMWHAGPEGKKAALLMMGMMLLISGADGLPFADDVGNLVDGVLQHLGYNVQTKRARQEFLAHVFGDQIGHFMSKGMTGLPGAPIDVSGRLGMAHLIPGTGLFPKKADHTNDAQEILGPAGDMAKRAFTAGGQLLDGHPFDAAVTMSPTATQNLRKSVDMVQTGQYRDGKGRKVIDTSVADALFKGIGFQPNDVARIQEASSQVQSAVDLTRLRTTELQAQMAQAIYDRDQGAQAKVRELVIRWNADNPDMRIKVSLPAVLKQVQQMRLSKADRIAKASPKGVRAEVRRELAQ